MSLLDHKDWFDIILEDTKINENDEIFESRNKINKFKSIELNENNLKKFKNTYKNLSHVRIDDSTIGKLFIDNNNVVGMINIEAKPNGEKWIQGLEIFGKYKGTGLSLGILDIGVKDLGAKYLSVRKTNTIAQKIYKKYGFTVYKSDDYMDYMKLSGYAKESPEFEDESIDFITENLLLNKKDLEINLDKFESGKSNVLLITGFSGSGKSTLASQLTSKYKCIHYELDCLDFYLGKTMTKEDAVGNEDGLVAFIDKKKLEPGLNLNNNELNELYREYIKFLINYCKSQKDKKFIIEGLQIYGVYQEGDTFITSCPMIIKGTSGIVSAIRAAKRNNGSFSKEFGPLIRWVLKDDKALNKLKKDIEGENMNESAKPKKCSQCGSDEIGTFIEGEPIYKCKKCGKYLGTVPFPNNTKESPEFDSVESDEIVEEGFKYNRNKFNKSLRNKNANSGKVLSENDIIKNGYEPIPKKLFNKLQSDANWIKSEFLNEYNKIKNNVILDDEEYQQLKFSDVVEISNRGLDVTYYLESNSARCNVMCQIFESNINNEQEDWDDSMIVVILSEVSYNLGKIYRKIEKDYNNKNSGSDKFEFLKYNDMVEELEVGFSLSFEMKLRKHIKESADDELDNFDEFDTFVEGANLDIMRELHKAKKEDKISLKKISKALNDGRYSDARKYYEDYKKRSERSINYIRSIDMTNTEEKISTVMYGIILFLNTSINVGCTALGVMIKPILGAGGAIYTISKFIYDVTKNNKEKKNLQKNDITVGSYQALVSNKLKELEKTIKYIDDVISEYESSNDLYDKYKEESVEDMMNENIDNDEIFEEGFKDIINKIKNRKNKNTLVKPEEIIKSGYKTLPKDLINSLTEDAKWINSELTKEFNKIKNNFIIDEISVKYSDIVKINSNEIKENYHKEDGKYRAVVLSDLLYCDGTPAYGIPHQKLRIDEDSLLEQVMNKVDTEFTGIIENIKSTYNKKHNNEKFRFLIDREYKEFKRPILTIVLVYESTLSKSDNSYKESVNNNFNDFELDYIFDNITESEYNRIKEENAIGQMLPQVPLNGETLSKTPDVESDVENLDNFINDADGVLKGEINNYVKEYVTDSDSSYDIYIESEISSLARTLSYKFKIPKKHAAILVKKAIFKNKCKMLAKKNTDRNDMKLVDAKKRLIDEEQEYRKMMKSMDEETKKQIESVSKKIEDEVEDSIDDIEVSLDDNSTTNKKDNKIRKNLSIKDDDKYIKDIDEQLKSLEKEKPVKEENEDNKDFTRRLKKYEDKRYNLEMKKAKLQANFMKEYVDENPVNLYTSEPEYSLIIERQELESSLKKAQELNNLESIRKYENKLKANELSIMKESVDINEVVLLEAAPIEDEIKDIIDVLREKGYHTKYSSPGHHHLRRKEDADHNGVYNGKLYSDARLMFDDDYKSIPDAPKYWYTRLVDDKTYLDVKPITYNSNDGTPDEAFAKWKDKYMTSLREWANEIGKKPGPKEKSEKDDEVTKESPEFGDIDDNYQDFCESVFEDLNIDLALDI